MITFLSFSDGLLPIAKVRLADENTTAISVRKSRIRVWFLIINAPFFGGGI